MTPFLPFLTAIPLLIAVVLFERDPASDHINERPPNSPAYVYQQRITESAQPPAALAESLPPSDTTAYEPSAPPAPSQRVTGAVSAAGGMGRDAMREWLRQADAPEGWVEDLVAIGDCESHGNPLAVGDSGNSLGWPQLWHGWYPDAGYSVEQWQDPVVAAAVAVHVRTVRGRYGGGGGWSCADLLGIP